MEEKKLEQDDGEQDQTKHIVVEKFINIGSTTIPIVSLFEDQPRYYVNVLKILIIINRAYVIELENMVEKFGTIFIG